MLTRLAFVLVVCTLLCQNFVFAEEESKMVFKEQRLASSSPVVPNIVDINRNFHNSVSEYMKSGKFLENEIDTLMLKKGSKFYVKSLQPLSSDTPEGSRVEFEAETNLFSPNQLSKVVFTGEVIENKPPRRVGRSSTLKLEIQKIKVDNISYKASAYISKVGKKSVRNGVLAATPIYFTNLADTAEVGTVTIDKVYKDPCQYSCETITTVARPFYYLGASFLQLADLLVVAPVVSLFRKGNPIDIPKESSFEIKLARDMALLRI